MNRARRLKKLFRASRSSQASLRKAEWQVEHPTWSKQPPPGWEIETLPEPEIDEVDLVIKLIDATLGDWEKSGYNPNFTIGPAFIKHLRMLLVRYRKGD